MSFVARQSAGRLWLLEHLPHGRCTTNRILARKAHLGKNREITAEKPSPEKNDSSSSGKQSRLESLPNPGLSRGDFMKLFQRSHGGRLKHKVYPFRWDWHLRMFLYSMGPPVALYIFSVVVDNLMLNDDEIVRIMELEEIREASRSQGRFHWMSGLWGWWHYDPIFRADKANEPNQNDEEKSDEKSSSSSIMQRLELRLAKIEKQFSELYADLDRRDEELERRMAQRKKELELQANGKDSQNHRNSPKEKSADEIIAAARQLSRSIARPSP